jgi:hypothetical protein
MQFTQNFRSDLDLLFAELDSGRHLAFTKFADGERLILDRIQHSLRKPFEQWDAGDESAFRQRLQDALEANLDRYYIGVSCSCCGDASGYKHGVSDHDWYLQHIRMPLSRVTISNLFVNGNYDRYIDHMSGRHFRLVSSAEGMAADFRVPRNAVNTDWDLDGLVDRLCNEDSELPIAVAAGPAGCIIVHEFWKRSSRQRTIIDIGSTLDPIIHGQQTRGYHQLDHPNRKKMCEWPIT